MKSDQSDLEDHEEIIKHIAGGEKGLAEITFQLEEKHVQRSRDRSQHYTLTKQT